LNTAPASIVPAGVYFLGVQNTNTLPVGYAVQVTFLTGSTTNPPTISSIVYTNIGGKNGYLLTWFAPSNDLFQVQWTGKLVPPTWASFTNVVGYNTNTFTSPARTEFHFFDDGSQTGGFGTTRFYRLNLINGPGSVGTSPTISSVVVTPTGVTLQWSGSANEVFGVRSTTNLTPPIVWTLLSSSVTSTNSIFDFTDTSSRSVMKFYELLVEP
jgi:hypothetical protein